MRVRPWTIFPFLFLATAALCAPRASDPASPEKKTPQKGPQIFAVVEYGPRISPEVQSEKDRYLSGLSEAFEGRVQQEAARKRLSLAGLALTPTHGFVAIAFFLNASGVITEKTVLRSEGEAAGLVERTALDALRALTLYAPPPPAVRPELGEGAWKFFCCWWPPGFGGLNDDLETAARSIDKFAAFLDAKSSSGRPLEIRHGR
ncbi:MAG: energy transducer TonB [Methylacidiphilaceae bacterium]|nr:energy transducer TonB [Candidatus Methylacidiphilaceae bacterium]